MPKLKALGANVNALAPRLANTRDAHGHSPSAEPWRGWYSTAAWQRLRVRVFVRDGYQCQLPECGKVIANPVADHRIPHRGDRVLFFDDDNVQTLCKPCHDSAKQAAERRPPGGGVSNP